MRKRTLLFGFLLGLLVTLTAAGSVFAAGFALYEGSARGNVLGAGLTAAADDPSAIFYNPAGITQLKGKQMMVGLTAITPTITVRTPGNVETEMEDNWFFPPHAYFTQQINDKLYWGAGLFSRFGLGTEFPETWPGRYNSYKASIQTLEFNPNVAYKISDSFSLAAGLSVMWFDLELKRKLQAPGGDIDFKLDGDSWGWGFNLAGHYKPTDWFSAGISYRSSVKQVIKGDTTVSRELRASPVANIVNTTGEGDLYLPDMLFIGVNFKPIKTLSVGGGVYWTAWSSYDKLEITFGQPFGSAPLSSVSSTPKNWEDVWRFMIGAEWAATDWMDLRLSVAYDQAPEPDDTVDYILPDDDRFIYSLGVGFHKNAWTLDLSYSLLIIQDREVYRTGGGVFPGKFDEGQAHLIGMSVGYKF